METCGPRTTHGDGEISIKKGNTTDIGVIRRHTHTPLLVISP
jgi:hypothetical protein